MRITVFTPFFVKQPDFWEVQKAIACYEYSRRSPVAYVVDFGVLSTGQTALVEVNDAFAFSKYYYHIPNGLKLASLAQFEFTAYLAKNQNISKNAFF